MPGKYVPEKKSPDPSSMSEVLILLVSSPSKSRKQNTGGSERIRCRTHRTHHRIHHRRQHYVLARNSHKNKISRLFLVFLRFQHCVQHKCSVWRALTWLWRRNRPVTINIYRVHQLSFWLCFFSRCSLFSPVSYSKSPLSVVRSDLLGSEFLKSRLT